MPLTHVELDPHRHLFTAPEIRLVNFLTLHPGWSSVADIVAGTSISARHFRRDGERAGIRTSASAKLFSSTGYCIIARTSAPAGFKISRDPAEIESAAKLIEDHLWSEKEDSTEWRRVARAIRSSDSNARTPQLTLELTHTAL